jgi:hypothetical protein
VTFVVRYATRAFAPPRTVSILSPVNDWENIEGTYHDGAWTFELDDGEIWIEPSYFKFVLDERFWMDDPYIRIAPEPGFSYTFDEEAVSFAMSTTDQPTPTVQPMAAAAPAAAALPVPQPVAAPMTIAIPTISEGAVVNRVVLLAAPFITVGAAWVAAVIARHVPGVKLDQTQIVSFMIAIVAVCLAAAWKWLQGWQQHELLVAQRLAAPVKAVVSTAVIPTTTEVPK